MNQIELLAPAGSLEKLKMAIIYGADAVYAGGEEFSLRTAAKNFSYDDLERGLEFVRKAGKKMILTANIIPHNEDLEEMPRFFEKLEQLKPDGIILSDLGVFGLAKKHCPSIPIHISTQANNVNYLSAKAWHEMGAKRIVLGRELSFHEIRTIREKTHPTLELEAFVHGAMCISYSGRCLLSNYMINRDSNRGNCAHPCRWKYYLVEEKRPGEYMNVYENQRGTYIFNSRDLCMIEYIPQLVESGITSFKIEGRVKTEYYVATVVKAYREAIDTYLDNPQKYRFNPKWMEELSKVSNRRYTTGFYLGKPDSEAQVYESSTYIRTYDIAAVVIGYDEQTGETILQQRNRIFRGDSVEVVLPGEDFFRYTIEDMKDEDGQSIDVAKHAKQIIKLNFGRKLPLKAMIRKQKAEERVN